MIDPTDRPVRLSPNGQARFASVVEAADNGRLLPQFGHLRQYPEEGLEVAKGFSGKIATGTMLAGYGALRITPDFPQYNQIQKLLRRCAGYSPFDVFPPPLDRSLKSGNEVYVRDIATRPQYFVHKAENQVLDSEESAKILAPYIRNRHLLFAMSGECLKELKIALMGGQAVDNPDYVRVIINEGVKSILKSGAEYFRKNYGPVETNLQDVHSLSFQYGNMMTDLKNGTVPVSLITAGGTPQNFTGDEWPNWTKYVSTLLNRPKKSPTRGKNRYIVGTNYTDDFATMLGAYYDDVYKHFALMAFIHSLWIYRMLGNVNFDAIDVEIKTKEDKEKGIITIQTDIINKETQYLGKYMNEPITMSVGRLSYVSICSRSLGQLVKEYKAQEIELEHILPFTPSPDDFHMRNVKHGFLVFKPAA